MKTTQSYPTILDNKKQIFQTKSYMDNNTEIHLFQYNQKKMLFLSK